MEITTTNYTPPIPGLTTAADGWRCSKCGHGRDHNMPTGIPPRPTITDADGTWNVQCYPKAFVTVNGLPF